MWNVPKLLLLMQCVMEDIRLGAQIMFEGLAVDEIQSLTAQEIENLEADRMPSESFGWKVLQVLSEKLCYKRAWRVVLL